MKTKKSLMVYMASPWIICIFSILVLCAILIVSNQSLKATEEAALTEFNKRQLVLAKEAAGGVEMYFKFLSQTLKAIGKEAVTTIHDEKATRKLLFFEFNKLKWLGVNDIGVIDANGIVKYNVSAPQIEGNDFSWRKYFKKLNKKPFIKTYITQFIEFKGVDKGKKGVIIAVPMLKRIPINNNGCFSDKFAGVVICTFQLNSVIDRFIAPIKALEKRNAFLFDNKLNVLWAPDKTLLGKNILKEVDGFPLFQEILKKMITGKSSTAEYSYHTYDDLTHKFGKRMEENLLAYVYVNTGDKPLVLCLWSPKDQAKKLIHPALVKHSILVGLVVAIVLIYFLYAITMSFRYNKTLEKEVDKKTNEFKESHQRLLTVLDSLDAGVYVSDMETDEIMFINKHLKESFGDVEGKICWQVFHPDQSGPCEFCKKQKLLTTDGKSVGVYVWESYNSNSDRWYEIRDRLTTWIDGRTVKLTISMDITSRKLADIELIRAKDEMETFCTILKEIGVQDTLDGVGVFLIKELQSILNTQYMRLFVFSSDRGSLFALSEKGCTVIKDPEQIQKVSEALKDLDGTTTLANKKLFTPPLLPDYFPAKGRQTVIPFRVQNYDDGAFVVNCTPDCLCDETKIALVTLILEKASGTIKRAVFHHEEVQSLESRIERVTGFSGIIGKDSKMQLIYKLIDDIAPTDATVLIQGETGTGKEMVARAMWQKSDRSKKPFVVINCSAYPSTLLESELFGHDKGAFTGALRRKLGRFEQAHGGTVFLDEVGEISSSAQIKLLRVLQTQKFERIGGEQTISVDVRILAATNRDLLQEVKKGNFREDLYYRLNVIPVQLPPLRSRRNDIPLLAHHFLRKFVNEHGGTANDFSSDVLKRLLDYHWPGNVRELENCIEHAVVLNKNKKETVDISLFPSMLRDNKFVPQPSNSKPRTIMDNEKQLLKDVLEECNWNKSQAAFRLGISRSTLYDKLKKYQISKPASG